MTMHVEFERMYDDRDEWIAFVVGGHHRRITDVVIQGDPSELSDGDAVTFRCWTGRETMRLGDLKKALLRPEARLTPDPIEDQIAALGLDGGG